MCADQASCVKISIPNQVAVLHVCIFRLIYNSCRCILRKLCYHFRCKENRQMHIMCIHQHFKNKLWSVNRNGFGSFI